MDFKFLDSIILDEEELINIRGGVSDGITCGSNCGMSCGNSCGSNCGNNCGSNCGTSCGINCGGFIKNIDPIIKPDRPTGPINPGTPEHE